MDQLIAEYILKFCAINSILTCLKTLAAKKNVFFII